METLLKNFTKEILLEYERNNNVIQELVLEKNDIISELEKLIKERETQIENLTNKVNDLTYECKNYENVSIHKNLGRIARLGRDIRRRKEKMKTTDDPRYFEECKKLIASWEHEAKERKWLVKAVSKKVDISNKGVIRHQNRKGQKRLKIKAAIKKVKI